MPGDIDQRRTDVDSDDVVKVRGERLCVSAGPTAGIQGPTGVTRQLRLQPVQDAGRLQAGTPIVVSGKSVKGLATAHMLDDSSAFMLVPCLASERQPSGNPRQALSLAIDPEPFDSREAQQLVAALDAGLAELYPPAQRFGPNLKAEHLSGGRGTFLVARDKGRPVGCGAIRMNDTTTAEVKRMYVEPDQRGRGVGRAVLARLEATARQLGARRLVLETGTHSPDALALYRRAGFRQIECWGEYAASPTSVCMEKTLRD